jgi:hypothetical protein
MRTNRCSEQGRALGGDVMDPVRRLVAAYAASRVLMLERDADDGDRDIDCDTHRDIDRDFVASSWSAPRRRHRTARRRGR